VSSQSLVIRIITYFFQIIIPRLFTKSIKKYNTKVVPMGYRPGSYLLKYAESQYWLRGVADIIERDEGFIIEGLKDAVRHHGARVEATRRCSISRNVCYISRNVSSFPVPQPMCPSLTTPRTTLPRSCYQQLEPSANFTQCGDLDSVFTAVLVHFIDHDRLKCY